MKYQPSYTITSKIIHLVEQISESIRRLTALIQIENSLMLRKANRIQTIQGSLAIEGNTLSTEQITAILNGNILMINESLVVCRPIGCLIFLGIGFFIWELYC